MILPFTITGTVIHGNSLGNTIDVPTANIIPEEDVTGLNMGVYRSSVVIDDRRYDAITNLGVKPTVSSEKRVSAESFVKGYEGNLYGKKIAVTLLEFERPEMKFNSFEELACQIKKDVQSILFC